MHGNQLRVITQAMKSRSQTNARSSARRKNLHRTQQEKTDRDEANFLAKLLGANSPLLRLISRRRISVSCLFRKSLDGYAALYASSRHGPIGQTITRTASLNRTQPGSHLPPSFGHSSPIIRIMRVFSATILIGVTDPEHESVRTLRASEKKKAAGENFSQAAYHPCYQRMIRISNRSLQSNRIAEFVLVATILAK